MDISEHKEDWDEATSSDSDSVALQSTLICFRVNFCCFIGLLAAYNDLTILLIRYHI